MPLVMDSCLSPRSFVDFLLARKTSIDYPLADVIHLLLTLLACFTDPLWTLSKSLRLCFGELVGGPLGGDASSSSMRAPATPIIETT